MELKCKMNFSIELNIRHYLCSVKNNFCPDFIYDICSVLKLPFSCWAKYLCIQMLNTSVVMCFSYKSRYIQAYKLEQLIMLWCVLALCRYSLVT